VEVIEGRGPSPFFVAQLVQRLPDTSMTHALANGGRDHFGWGIDRYLLADLFDALNQNTRATGNWGKGKAPKFPQWPRPKSRKVRDEDKPKTVAELYARFNRR
jgi:hypothetical protein